MNKRNLEIVLYFLPILLIIVSLFIGPSKNITFSTILDFILNRSISSNFVKSIIIDVRLPRIFITFIIFGVLAVSGCSIQAIFRNPLTDHIFLAFLRELFLELF